MRFSCLVFLVAPPLIGQALGPDKGWLILEGGSVPVDPLVAQAFIKLGGGPDKRFVWIPTAADDDRLDLSKLDAQFAPFGTPNFKVLHTRDRAAADSEDFVKVLRTANGVWMSGGKPQNLQAAYGGTLVLKELRALLDRGGVVGGSSAGAMVMPSTMIVGVKRRGTGPTYLPGFGLFKNVGLFVHVEQRHIDEDLLDSAKARPELLIVGIDTATAAVVQRERLEAIGKKRVQIVEDNRVLTLAAGDRFNLRTKEAIHNPQIAVGKNVQVSSDRPDLFHGRSCADHFVSQRGW